ncbi:MAG: DinB family protein [Bacteroidota bacterium]
MKNIGKPKQGEYPAYFELYYHTIPEGNIFEILMKSNMETIDLITSVDGETLEFRYAEGKWNIPEIIQHVMDSERIFTYRALRIARGDKSENPGYDENIFAANSNASSRNIMDMVREFSILRASTIELFKSLSEDALKEVGYANGYAVTPAALIYALAGHEMHHLKIIEERYLPK